MKTLGLIGGTSWISTIEYYRIINQKINERLGAHNSAKLFLYSLNFEEFRPPSDPSQWGELTNMFTEISNKLVQCGAQCILLCANTPHMAADELEKRITVPLIHIADATASEIAKTGSKKIGLLGTKITMEQDFFKQRLIQRGIEPLVPGPDDRTFVDTTIFSELTNGIIKQETKKRYLQIIEKFREANAEGVIFGCTEIPFLIPAGQSPLPSFNTTMIHATAAVDFALQ